jgi:hypothetical protein
MQGWIRRLTNLEIIKIDGARFWFRNTSDREIYLNSIVIICAIYCVELENKNVQILRIQIFKDEKAMIVLFSNKISCI